MLASQKTQNNIMIPYHKASGVINHFSSSNMSQICTCILVQTCVCIAPSFPIV